MTPTSDDASAIPRYPFSTATVGGTFDALHAGHERYLEIGCSLAYNVHVHLTSDEFAAVLKSYPVKPFEVRRSQLLAFFEKRACADRVEIHALHSNDELRAFAIAERVGVAVVEPAYVTLFLEINRQRRALGIAELCLLIKPRSEDADGELSSTRIAAERTRPA